MPKTPDSEDPNVSIVFKGTTFTFPKDADDWDATAELARIRAIKTKQLDDWVEFVRQVVGAAKFDAFAKGVKRRDLYEFTRLFNTTVNEECTV